MSVNAQYRDRLLCKYFTEFVTYRDTSDRRLSDIAKERINGILELYGYQWKEYDGVIMIDNYKHAIVLYFRIREKLFYNPNKHYNMMYDLDKEEIKYV